jgi:hypothetical protein
VNEQAARHLLRVALGAGRRSGASAPGDGWPALAWAAWFAGRKKVGLALRISHRIAKGKAGAAKYLGCTPDHAGARNARHEAPRLRRKPERHADGFLLDRRRRGGRGRGRGRNYL